MTLNELKNKLEKEKHITGSIQIECGKKSEFPNILGIYEENGCWYIYDTNEKKLVRNGKFFYYYFIHL